jgi:DNA-binding transcriptional ArsR family regulator
MTPLLSPQPVAVRVALEPVYNILVSMGALDPDDHSSGLSAWATQTARTLPPEVTTRNRLLLRGIGSESIMNLLPRGPATEDFPTALAHLAAQDAVHLRDQLLYWTIHSPAARVFADTLLLPEPSVAEVLADPSVGLAFFEARSREKFPPALIQPVFTLLAQPDELQATLVEHLHWLWEAVVAEEWGRICPLLQESVAAFQAVDLTGLTILEAIQTVTGRDLRTLFRLETLLPYRRIRFLPTLHNGPYISWFGDDDELRMTYLARRPQPTVGHFSTLDHSELANRLDALADGVRLQILYALGEAGELSTQEIIDRFDLNKSAASRHLRQLFASNLIGERREEGAKKVYTLNRRTLAETLTRLAPLIHLPTETQ